MAHPNYEDCRKTCGGCCTDSQGSDACTGWNVGDPNKCLEISSSGFEHECKVNNIGMTVRICLHL